MIKNLTPHCVTVVDSNNNIVAEYPSEGIARAIQSAEHVGELEGIELVRMTFGHTENLPAPQADVYLIVSVVTANAAKAEGRSTDDLLITADPARDENGRIIGCRKFALV